MGALGGSITIGGLPGTGTTTACAKLKAVTGLPYVYTGQIFRDLAKARNMTLEAFGTYAETHPEIDRSIDDRQVELLRGPPLLLEGRVSGFLAYRERIPAYKVWFHADPRVRAERVVQREGGDVDDRMAESRAREASERTRYIEFYGFDPSDLSVYDLVLDTTNLTPLEVVESIVKGYQAPKRRRPRFAFWRR